MKSTKNKIFCVSCKLPKMLFESQAKADNFILYNAQGKGSSKRKWCITCGKFPPVYVKMPIWNLEESFFMFKVPIWRLKDNLLHYNECKLLIKLHLLRCNFHTIYFLRSD
jgi:hypothetical protein